MPFESNHDRMTHRTGTWVEDAVKLQTPKWIKWLALSLTVVSCVIYGYLFVFISSYKQQIAGTVQTLPIFTRVVLNIYQPFLVVFIIISVSMLVMFNLKLRRARWSYKGLLVLIACNELFAVSLLVIRFIKLN